MIRDEKKILHIGLALFQIGMACWSPVYFLVLKSKGLSDFEALNLNVLFFALSVILEFPTGVVADKFGYKFSTLLGILCWGFSSPAFAFGQTWLHFAIGESIAAVGMSLISGAKESWIRSRFGLEGYHSFQTKNELMSQIVPIPFKIACGFLAISNLQLPYLVSTVIILSSCIVLMYVPSTDKIAKKSAKHISQQSLRLFLSNKLLVNISIVFGVIGFAQHGLFMFWTQITVDNAGWGIGSLGVLSALLGVFIAFGIWLFHHTFHSNSTKNRLQNILFRAALGVVVTTISFGVVTYTFANPSLSYLFPLALMIFEIGVGWNKVCLSSLMQECLNKEDQSFNASITSLASGVVRIGSVFGLLMAGYVSDNFGRIMYFQLSFWTLVILSIITVLSMKNKTQK